MGSEEIRAGKGKDAVMEIIPSTLRFTLIAGVICYFILILHYLKQRVLNLKYTLLWLLAGAVMGLLVVFPELLVYAIHLFGIEDNVSRLDRKVRKLVQEMGIMDKRIRELEERMNECINSHK